MMQAMLFDARAAVWWVTTRVVTQAFVRVHCSPLPLLHLPAERAGTQ